MFELLKYFQYLTKILSSDKDVSSNTLLDKLDEAISEFDKKHDSTQENMIILSSLVKGCNKLIKHYKKCNWVFYIALLFDPRFKVKGFNSTEWDKDLKDIGYICHIAEKNPKIF